jgi:nicotinate-nucleotide adenylyltransferase
MTGGRAERVGVFGGTFDPPHIGHLVAALEVRERLGLDRMLIVPANVPWQKVGSRKITSAAIRLEMVRAATAGLPGLEVSDQEIRRGGDSFTIDTVEELLAEEASRQVFVVVGADTEPLLDTWERIEDLRAMAAIVVVSRGGEAAGDVGDDRVERVAIPRLEVSSTDLRKRVADGRTIDVLVPPEVHAVFDAHRLYRVAG